MNELPHTKNMPTELPSGYPYQTRDPARRQLSNLVRKAQNSGSGEEPLRRFVLLPSCSPLICSCLFPQRQIGSCRPGIFGMETCQTGILGARNESYLKAREPKVVLEVVRVIVNRAYA